MIGRLLALVGLKRAERGPSLLLLQLQDARTTLRCHLDRFDRTVGNPIGESVKDFLDASDRLKDRRNG